MVPETLDPQKTPPIHNWEELATGKSGNIALEESWLQKAQIMFEMFCQKQHDYGPHNIGLGGAKGCSLRMGDKMTRLWNLQGLGTSSKPLEASVSDESVEDTLYDLADYALIELMVINGEWPLTLVEDAWKGEK
jgi:hypothetical protein